MPQTPQYQRGYADGRALMMQEVQRLRQTAYGLRVVNSDLQTQVATLQSSIGILQATYDAYVAGHP